MGSAAFAQALTEAEERLRATGLTGASAFEAVRDTLLHRLGADREPHRALASLTVPEGDLDLLGLAYERFFPDRFKARKGQYFTPREIGSLLLSRLPLGPGTTVLDPTCGCGGLLVLAGRTGASVRGIDIDPAMVDLARLNLALARVDGAVERANLFTTAPTPVDVVVANPPFSMLVRAREVLDRFETARGLRQVSSDVIFLEALEGWVRPGGHAGVVLPWTVIANPSMAAVRERLDAHWVRRGLCELPEGTFRPFGGAAGRAALLWLQRRPAEEAPMAWSVLTDPGYDPTSTRLIRTSDAEREALEAGRGWRSITGWMPTREGQGSTLGDWAELSTRTVKGAAQQLCIDLADVHRETGEVVPLVRDNRGRKALLRRGQVLVSRIRPELGTVAVVPDEVAVCAGSPEWIRLTCEVPHFLMLALRSPAWRGQLPPTGGQTRPRTDPSAVLATRVPRPDGRAREIDARVRELFRVREEALEELRALQAEVDGWMEAATAVKER